MLINEIDLRSQPIKIDKLFEGSVAIKQKLASLEILTLLDVANCLIDNPEINVKID